MAGRTFSTAIGNLIYAVAVKAGLTDAEAQDVVQETVVVRGNENCGRSAARKTPARACAANFPVTKP